MNMCVLHYFECVRGHHTQVAFAWCDLQMKHSLVEAICTSTISVIRLIFCNMMAYASNIAMVDSYDYYSAHHWQDTHVTDEQCAFIEVKSSRYITVYIVSIQ